MSVWNVCCIDELGSVNRGKSKHRPRNDVILFGGLYPFIQTADVKRANLYITEYNETYSDAGLAQSKLWKKGLANVAFCDGPAGIRLQKTSGANKRGKVKRNV